MGLGKEETTQSTSIPGMSPEARQLMQIYLGLAGDAAEGLGGMDQVEATVSPEQRMLIQQGQEATGEIALGQMETALDSIYQQSEANALDRGIEGSTIEAVNTAINARELQRQVNEMIQRQRAESSQQMLNTGFANAELNLNRNQQMLQALLGAGNPILQSDISARTAQPTTNQVTEGSALAPLMQLGTQIGGMALAPASGGITLTPDILDRLSAGAGSTPVK
jgi:hypothetical protein